jgi:hypothetical protein
MVGTSFKKPQDLCFALPIRIKHQKKNNGVDIKNDGASSPG